MSEFAVRAEGLGKRYGIGQVETAVAQLRRLVGRGQARETNWALRDLSFEIGEGEAVAIVGRNGAGKSTLLKVLSRITEPTEGYVDVRGRVGALLEVGTGFHHELTGRENVYLNGAILGMRRREVARKFDQIVEFAGVERYIDTPVKWYSSGMYVRLAFAVAAHLEPEILIVDEVLAVGDAEFQKRCLGRMGEVAREGRTVLFVSHNMQAVRRLCERALLLDQGRLAAEGDVETVVQRYLAGVEAPDLGTRRWDDAAIPPGNDFCRLVGLAVTAGDGRPRGSFMTSQPIEVTLEFDLDRVEPAFSAAFDLVSIDGSTVLRTAQTDLPDGRRPELKRGRNVLRCTIPPGLLNTGRYLLNLRFSLHLSQWVVYEDNALAFDVLADHGESLYLNAEGRPGVIAPILEWEADGPEAGAEALPARVQARP